MSQKYNLFSLFLKIIFFIILCNTKVFAISIPELSASVQYGENETLKEACILAKEKFFDKARRQASDGETISAESTKVCKKSENENDCKLYTNSFRSIASIQIVDYKLFDFKDGTYCKYSSLGNKVFEATVKGSIVLKKLPKPDVNFDFRVEINKNDFLAYPINKNKDKLKKNEILKINVETVADMYISVFQWLPYQDSYSIQKIFPNVMDTNNLFKSNELNSIPSNTRLKDYSLRVHYPNEDEIFTDDVQEFLMIIGTKEKVSFFDKYNYAEFGEKLADIENFRQARKSYIVRKRVD